MKGLFSTSAAFILVVLTGGAWIGVAQNITDGQPGMALAVVGGVFSAAFMWLLVVRLRRLLGDPDRRWLEAGLLLFNIALLIATFAWIHHRIGIMDLSGPAPRPTRDFGDALYFSIVTVTTLGYGDFIPMGVGRAVAAIQGLVGYFILGILVSTGFQLLAPDDERDDDRDDQ